MFGKITKKDIINNNHKTILYNSVLAEEVFISTHFSTINTNTRARANFRAIEEVELHSLMRKHGKKRKKITIIVVKILKKRVRNPAYSCSVKDFSNK